MKNSIIILIVILLSSCSNEYVVRLKNGSVIVATDNMDRPYRCGNTVCVRTTNGREWFMDTHGNMSDTITAFTFKRADSIERVIYTESRIGVIIRR